MPKRGRPPTNLAASSRIKKARKLQKKVSSYPGKNKMMVGKLPKRGMGVVRPTGAKISNATSPATSKRTAINPGNVDPSPAPKTRVGASQVRYMHQKHSNPSNLNGAMLKVHKSFSNRGPMQFGKKIIEARG
jgi:hypothetical protein